MSGLLTLFVFCLIQKYFNTLSKGFKQQSVDEYTNTLDAATLSGILKVKQKLGVTFNFDKQDVIDLTKISKMTMCRALEANS